MAKTQQPTSVGRTSTSSNQWSTGILDFCDDVPECCFAFWLLPCFACMTAKKHGECLCLPALDYFGCIPPITLALRATLRQRYGIEGTICNDCLYTVFCYACVWCQMSREIKAREGSVTFINFHGK